MMIRPTHAVIDLDALRNNLGVIRSHLAPQTEIMAVVKADCYGHSAALCVPELLAHGVRRFAVATVEEGEALRALGLRERITVLAPPLEGQYQVLAEHDLEPLISSVQMAETLHHVAISSGRKLRAHLFVDTGLARNGMPLQDVVESLGTMAAFDGVEVTGLCSHFACSDEPDNPFNQEQIRKFSDVVHTTTEAGFTFQDVHLSNSGGILHFPEAQHTLVRPGLALYGYHPTRNAQQQSRLQPVMTLHTMVANIWPMSAGRSISYGRRYFTTADTRIASLPIGYADGLMRVLTNRLEVLIAGRRVPTVGTICMDEVMIDLGTDDDIDIGDDVIIIGRQGDLEIDAWELAEAAGTIPYEICTSISARVPRIIRNEHKK
jgi:alanine racemase